MSPARHAAHAVPSLSLKSYSTAIHRAHWLQSLSLLVQADLIAFSAAITSCQKAKAWRFATFLLPRNGDCIAFNAAISACSEVWQQAHELLLQEERAEL
eukprot:g16251.t1